MNPDILAWGSFDVGGWCQVVIKPIFYRPSDYRNLFIHMLTVSQLICSDFIVIFTAEHNATQIHDKGSTHGNTTRTRVLCTDQRVIDSDSCCNCCLQWNSPSADEVPTWVSVAVVGNWRQPLASCTSNPAVWVVREAPSVYLFIKKLMRLCIMHVCSAVEADYNALLNVLFTLQTEWTVLYYMILRRS